MLEITLKVFWSKKENDFMVCYPNSKASGGYVLAHLIGKRTQFKHKPEDGKADLWDTERPLWDEGQYSYYEHDFVKEMEHRGFDVKTMKFSIKLNIDLLKDRFPEIYNSLSSGQKDKLGIK